MAWGGPEEQEKEQEAGNFNAKDWQAEALKIVEATMEDYWQRDQTVTVAATSTATSTAVPNAVTASLESDFDRHRRELIKKTVNRDGGGWRSELHRYLEGVPDDVAKDTDIVQWWSVS